MTQWWRKKRLVPKLNNRFNPEDNVGKELLNVPFEILTMKMELSLHAKDAYSVLIARTSSWRLLNS